MTSTSISSDRPPVTPEVAREMLTFIPADCGRAEWARVGMALKSEFGEAGRPLFDEWSRTAPDRYNAGNFKSTWKGLDASGKAGNVTFRTLVRLAKLGGWAPPSHASNGHASPPPRPPVARKSEPFQARKETKHQIRDVDGTLVALHVRLEVPGETHKRVWWEQLDGTRGLKRAAGQKLATLPLYGVHLLPGAAPDDVLVVVEGEKAAYSLQGEPGVLALGTVTGSATAPGVEPLKPIVESGRAVYLWPDADDAGAKHMQKVARNLVDAGYSDAIRLLKVPDAADTDDADDWVSGGKVPPMSELMDASEVVEVRKRGEKRGSDEDSRLRYVAAKPDDKDNRTLLYIRRGGRNEWSRDAVDVLLAAGDADHKRSLYETARGIVKLDRAADPEEDDVLKVPAKTLRPEDVAPLDICVLIDAHARWLKEGAARKGEVNFSPGNPSKDDAMHILARYRDLKLAGGSQFRVLRGIVDSPVLRRDGSLLADPGYDERSGLYADFLADVWQGIPPEPSLSDAREALGRLYKLVKESPFFDGNARTAWVSLLLTLVARPWIGGNVPLHAFSANVAGAGKGTLVDLAALIATGRTAAKWTPISGRAAAKEEEERKRMFAVALQGARMVCIDNVPAGSPIGSAALDAALTAGTDKLAGTIADRVLGESATIELPWLCVMAATGNNLVGRGDIARRAVLCRLQCEDDPAGRRFRLHPSIADHVLRNRSKYLSDCLTVLVAWRDAMNAGADPLPDKVPSFGNWSDFVRSAIAWADPDGADPWGTNSSWVEDAQPEQIEAYDFFKAWWEWRGSTPVTIKEIAGACARGTHVFDEGLADAVEALPIAPPRGNAALNVPALSRWLAARADLPGEFVPHKSSKRHMWAMEHKPIPKKASPADHDSGEMGDYGWRPIEEISADKAAERIPEVAEDVVKTGRPKAIRITPSPVHPVRMVPVHGEGGRFRIKMVPEGIHPDDVPALGAEFLGASPDTPENREKAAEHIAKMHPRYYLEPEARLAWARREIELLGIDRALIECSNAVTDFLTEEEEDEQIVRRLAERFVRDDAAKLSVDDLAVALREQSGRDLDDLSSERTDRILASVKATIGDIGGDGTWAGWRIDPMQYRPWWEEEMPEETGLSYAARFVRADDGDVTFGDALRALCKQCGEDPDPIEENLAHTAEVIEKIVDLVPGMGEPEIVDPKLPARGDNVVWRGWKLK